MQKNFILFHTSLAISSRHGSVRKYHFTLIELLVVIAMIAILAGMLLPALNKARTRVTTINCLSNQKQLSQALLFYADENNGYIPQNTSLTSAEATKGMARYFYEKYYLENYLGSGRAKIIICPGRTSAEADSTNGNLTDCSYGMENKPISWGLQNIKLLWKPVSRNLMLIDFAKLTLWYRSNTKGLDISYFNGTKKPNNYVPWERHGQAANMTFFDGHGETMNFSVFCTRVSSGEFFAKK